MLTSQVKHDVHRRVTLGDLTASERRMSVFKVLPVKIYCVYRGRNAWNETWAEHYLRAAFHRTFAQAQMTAENQRTQGSVFTIQEWPALCFLAKTRSLVVIELGQELPFLNFSAAALELVFDRKTGVMKHRDTRDRPLRKGCRFEKVIEVFERMSSHWHERPNFIASELFCIPQASWQTLEECQMKAWRSIPAGSNYLLRWRDIPHPVFPNAAIRLANSVNRRTARTRVARKKETPPCGSVRPTMLSLAG